LLAEVQATYQQIYKSFFLAFLAKVHGQFFDLINYLFDQNNIVRIDFYQRCNDKLSVLIVNTYPSYNKKNYFYKFLFYFAK